MKRHELLERIKSEDTWDVAIIGGGAVGLGAALDASSRGYSTVLLEQHDFSKGTSSRSTKLIHGGVRYLAQGNVSLVRESLHERGLLLRIAPTLVTPLRFVVPCYGRAERWYYAVGMKAYDTLAGRLGIHASHQMSNDEVAAAIPALDDGKLRGGVAYYDAQFDDAGLALAVARKVLELGGTPLNYVGVERLLMQSGKVRGVHARDQESGLEVTVKAKVVINAAGVFSDDVRRMENPAAANMIAPSQGIHLVVDRRFLGGSSGLLIPKTSDGRVLFAIPWMERVLLGTTDTSVDRASLEPQPLDQEVHYLLEHFADYLRPAPTISDVISAFAGLRPLVKPDRPVGPTSRISREHEIVISEGGLVSILGGKWTTFRKMSESVIDAAAKVADLPPRAPQTSKVELAPARLPSTKPWDCPSEQEVQGAIRDEFARSVEDILARRWRLLLLDARHSASYAPRIALQMAAELGHSEDWVNQQIRQYEDLVDRYTVAPR